MSVRRFRTGVITENKKRKGTRKGRERERFRIIVTKKREIKCGFDQCYQQQLLLISHFQIYF